jgi:hypothetical protein
VILDYEPLALEFSLVLWRKKLANRYALSTRQLETAKFRHSRLVQELEKQRFNTIPAARSFSEALEPGETLADLSRAIDRLTS